MDVLRVAQLITDVAYLILGVVAIREALRVRERVRVDVALLFGTLAAVVVLSEIGQLSCLTALGCTTIPAASILSALLILVLPYALLRLLDDIADVPDWLMWVALVLLVAFAITLVISLAQGAATWLGPLLLVYLIVGTAYPALAFVQRARSTTGITRRRMAAIAWGCALLAMTFILSLIGQASPRELAILQPLGRVCGLVSGFCFWAGFFTPRWLSRTWRLPELLEYLRPARLMLASPGKSEVVSEALALDRLTAATARTTGARRVLLILEDATQHDLYLWGAP
jgi:hypothetical protein